MNGKKMNSMIRDVFIPIALTICITSIALFSSHKYLEYNRKIKIAKFVEVYEKLRKEKEKKAYDKLKCWAVCHDSKFRIFELNNGLCECYDYYTGKSFIFMVNDSWGKSVRDIKIWAKCYNL